MYSFAQRSDTKVFDEPLYAHYLSQTGAVHLGRTEVLKSQENDGNKVVNNVNFIRNPKEIIASYTKVIPNPKMEDIGVKKQYELYNHLDNIGKTPIVLDSKYLLKNPKIILNKLCDILAIPFNTNMLEWEKGARKEDGIWAKYWYQNIHNSTGFLPYTKKEINLENSNLDLSEKCQPYYEFLTNKSIRI